VDEKKKQAVGVIVITIFCFLFFFFGKRRLILTHDLHLLLGQHYRTIFCYMQCVLYNMCARHFCYRIISCTYITRTLRVLYTSALGAEFVRFPLILFHIRIHHRTRYSATSARPTHARSTRGGCTLIARPGVTNYTTCPHVKNTSVRGMCRARAGGRRETRRENHRRRRSKRCRRP